MNKKLFPFLICSIATVSAFENDKFQQFDNQISVGYSYSSNTLYNNSNMNLQQNLNNNLFNLNIERLFDNGVWFDINGAFVFNSTQSIMQNSFIDVVQALGLPANITGKVGYAFPLLEQHLQLTPYFVSGKELNYNGVTVPAAGFNNSFYYLLGGGGRIEYLINNNILLYFEQMVGYLKDSSGGNINLSALNLTSVLAAKFNLTDNFQLGLQGFFNQINVIDQNAGYNPITYTYRNINQSTFGGLLSVGYAYGAKNKQYNILEDNFVGDNFYNFDNMYSLGLGFATSKSYNSNNPNKIQIGTNTNYIDINITHLWNYGLWFSIDAQLINSISQSNVPASKSNNYAPTYLTFPGNATVSLGYAFPLVNNYLQIIPYLNSGLIMNINSYTISQNLGLSYQLSHDMYVQYGGGIQLEYAINNIIELYANQLLANMHDNSGLGLGTWRSTSTIGIKFNLYDSLMLGINTYYDQIMPSAGSNTNVVNNIYYNLNQNTFGGLISIGLKY